MGFTVLSLIISFLLRIPALYIALSQQGFNKMETPKLIFLAAFATLLGVIMPATGFDVAGVLFRIALFAVVLVFFMQLEFLEAITVVFVSSILLAIMIFALSLSPVSFLVEGLGLLSIP